MNVIFWVSLHNLENLQLIEKLSDFSQYNESIAIYTSKKSQSMINISLELSKFNELLEFGILQIKEDI